MTGNKLEIHYTGNINDWSSLIKYRDELLRRNRLASNIEGMEIQSCFIVPTLDIDYLVIGRDFMHHRTYIWSEYLYPLQFGNIKSDYCDQYRDRFDRAKYTTNRLYDYLIRINK